MIYAVKNGDTLSRIAKQHGLDLPALLAMNPHIFNPNRIYVGQRINIEVSEPVEEANIPSWLRVADKEWQRGVNEVVGPGEHNPRIIEYHQATTLKATDDETPWCSAFVCWVMEQAGYPSTRSAAARSWLRWGKALPGPQVGAVVVYRRGNSSWQGHVGFVYNHSEGGRIATIGGNQSNRVNVTPYPKSKVLGYRWPKETGVTP